MEQAHEIAAIRQLMADAQRVAVDRGTYFLVWGALSVIGVLVTYAGLVLPGLGGALIWGSWVVLMGIGAVTTVVLVRRHWREARVRTLADRLVTDIWQAVGATIVVVVFGGGLFGAVAPELIPGLVSALVGTAFAATASLYPGLPLRWLGAGWWAGALVMLLWPGPYTLLLMAALVLLLQVVPGLVLRSRAGRPAAGAGG